MKGLIVLVYFWDLRKKLYLQGEILKRGLFQSLLWSLLWVFPEPYAREELLNNLLYWRQLLTRSTALAIFLTEPLILHRD